MADKTTYIEDAKGSTVPAKPQPGVRTALWKSSGMVVGARICGAVFGLLSQVLLAKFLGAQDIGIFFVAIGLAAILSIICTLGYPMLVPRIAAESACANDPLKLAGFMGLARKDISIISAFTVFSLLLAAWQLPSLSQELRTSLVFAALTLPAFVLLRLNGSLANALKRFELGFLPDLFVRPLSLLGMVLVLGFVWHKLSIEVVLAGHVAIAISIALWQMNRLANRTGLARSKLGNGRNPTRSMKSDLRRRAAPLVLAALFIGVFADLDIVIARLFLDDVQIGILGVCLKISLLVGFGIQAIHQLILRDTADAIQEKDNSRVHKVLARANVLTLVGSIGATIVVLIFGRDILGVFGSEFQAGFECLVVLMFAQVVRAAGGPAAQILTLTGHEKACLPVFSVCLLALLVMNAVLITLFGLLGAAFTVLLVSALWSIWLAKIADQKLNLKTNTLVVSNS